MDVKGVVAALAGLILVYAAVKDKAPMDVIKMAWGQGKPPPKKVPLHSPPAPTLGRRAI
jgi:hypothetical protein